MIIDVNAYIGHWPFRQLRYNTASGLLRLMDKHGIDKAIVSSLNAIFYKNSHAGNEELAAETKRHRDRLIPFATLNPTYAGWKDDLQTSYEKFGMKGLRIFPHYHNYRLVGEDSLNLIHEASERKMAVAFPMRVVDRRQRHWLDNVPDLTLTEIEDLIRRGLKTTFIILNGIGFENSRLVKDESFKKLPFLIEISRLTSVLQGSIPRLLDALGTSKLVFGTGIPLKYPAPALLKMEILDAPKRTKEKIYYGNVNKVLGLKG